VHSYNGKEYLSHICKSCTCKRQIGYRRKREENKGKPQEPLKKVKKNYEEGRTHKTKEISRNEKADLQLKNLQKRLKTGIIVVLKDIPEKTIRKYEITGTNTRMIFLKDSQGKTTSYQWTDFLIGKLKIKICA
jgi:hypothetical protein